MITINTDSVKLKYNERVVEVNEVIHTGSHIAHRLATIEIKDLLEDGNTFETTLASSSNIKLVIRTNIKLHTAKFFVYYKDGRTNCTTLEDAIEEYNNRNK